MNDKPKGWITAEYRGVCGECGAKAPPIPKTPSRRLLALGWFHTLDRGWICDRHIVTPGPTTKVETPVSIVKRTTVINVRGCGRAELLADPDFVYVGRAVPRAGWEKNPDFSNPFYVSRFRNAADLFMRCLLAALGQGDYPQEIRYLSWRFQAKTYWEPMAQKLHTLHGKKLGCRCCNWDGEGEPAKPCHAVVLARLADSLGELASNPIVE